MNEEEEKSRTQQWKKYSAMWGKQFVQYYNQTLETKKGPRFLCVIHKRLDSVTFHISSRVQSRLLPRKESSPIILIVPVSPDEV